MVLLILLLLHHALADAQHELDLEARHRLSLRRTRPSSSPRSRVSSLHPEASLHSEAVQRALRAVGVRSHTGTVFHCRMRQPRARLRAAAAMATLQFGLIWTADDGTCADNLFLRSRVCICDLGAFAQPRVHTRMGSAPALVSVQAVCKREFVLLLALSCGAYPSTGRNQVTFQATKVYGCIIFSCTFFLRGPASRDTHPDVGLGTIGSM